MTDFAKYLTKYFSEYLAGERGASSNTIRAYSNTFTQLLIFMNEQEHITADRLLFTQNSQTTKPVSTVCKIVHIFSFLGHPGILIRFFLLSNQRFPYP